MREIVVQISRCGTGGYEGRALGLSAFTCAPTIEEPKARVRDASTATSRITTAPGPHASA